MKKDKSSFFFILLVIVSIAILLIIGFDILPFFRGPAPYPPEWQWTYRPGNTLTKLWFPFLVGLAILCLAYWSEKQKKLSEKKYLLFLGGVFFLGILLQISILYYSRAGVSVLLHRVLDPEITSYFSTSLRVSSIPAFLHDFNTNFPTFPMYARYHPPLGTIIYSFFTFLSHFISPHFSFITHLTPSSPDVARFWNPLNPDQKLTAVLSSFFIMILTTLTLLPLVLTAKQLFNEKTAMRISPLFILIPSVILFIPMNDAFMPLFTATSSYFFLKAIKKKSFLNYFLSGLTMSIGTLFSLTFFLLFIFFGFLGICYLLTRELLLKNLWKIILSFSLGFLLLPLILFLLFHYNFFESVLLLLKAHHIVEDTRSYTLGLFYAPFDFFLFLGIPLSVFLFGGLIYALRIFKKYRLQIVQKVHPFLLSFWLFVIVATLQGSVRVESARIWTPFVPLAVLAAATEIHRRKISTNQFLIILLLLVIQVIVFQTVLVTVW